MPEAPPAAAPRLVMAFDFGRRRIGVACGGTLSAGATPLGAVQAGSAGRHWPPIDALLREWQPQLIVVGLPYNADGSESDMSAAARAFAQELHARSGLEVVLVDERYSSLEAHAKLRDSRQSGARTRRVARADIDAGSACVILERWIKEHS